MKAYIYSLNLLKILKCGNKKTLFIWQLHLFISELHWNWNMWRGMNWNVEGLSSLLYLYIIQVPNICWHFIGSGWLPVFCWLSWECEKMSDFSEIQSQRLQMLPVFPALSFSRYHGLHGESVQLVPVRPAPPPASSSRRGQNDCGCFTAGGLRRQEASCLGESPWKARACLHIRGEAFGRIHGRTARGGKHPPRSGPANLSALASARPSTIVSWCSHRRSAAFKSRLEGRGENGELGVRESWQALAASPPRHPGGKTWIGVRRGWWEYSDP